MTEMGTLITDMPRIDSCFKLHEFSAICVLNDSLFIWSLLSLI